MEIPFWALGIMYWLHMAATVVWIGGLASLALLVLPAARRTLDGRAYPAFLAALQRRLNPLAWTCLAVLGGTGLFQLSANPNYHGFLAIENRWAVAILAKHLLVGLMVGISAYLTWVVLPKIQRMALRSAAHREENLELPEVHSLQSQETLLLRLNLALGLVVLALTAIARAS